MSLELNALFRKYAGTLADLDSQEFRSAQAATQSQMKLDRTLKDSERNLSDNMATKGMTHSGVNLEENVKLKKDHGEATDTLARNAADNLAEIARKRLASTTEYETAKAYDPIKMLQEALQEG